MALGWEGECQGPCQHTPVIPALQKLRQEDAKFQHGHIAISSSKPKQSPKVCCVAGVGQCGDLKDDVPIAYILTCSAPELSRKD